MPEDCRRLTCGETVYLVTDTPVAPEAQGAYLGVLARSCVFDADTGRELTRAELEHIEPVPGPLSAQRRESRVYGAVYALEGTDSGSAVAVEVDGRIAAGRSGAARAKRVLTLPFRAALCRIPAGGLAQKKALSTAGMAAERLFCFFAGLFPYRRRPGALPDDQLRTQQHLAYGNTVHQTVQQAERTFAQRQPVLPDGGKGRFAAGGQRKVVVAHYAHVPGHAQAQTPQLGQHPPAMPSLAHRMAVAPCARKCGTYSRAQFCS